MKKSEFFGSTHQERNNLLIFLLVTICMGVPLALFFSGLHTFFCFVSGSAWVFYLFRNSKLETYFLLKRWRMSYYRYSFIRVIKNIDKKLNKFINPKKSQKIRAGIRVFQPTFFFFIINFFLQLSLEWHFVALGALCFEIFISKILSRQT